MAANFYLSSHANHHLHPRSTLIAARADDLKYASEAELGWIEIWSATFIQKLARRLGLKQPVVATAIVFFRRFYLRNAYCDTDPPLIAATCVYVAAKAEETPIHVKSAVQEAREVCSEMGYRQFPTDNTKLAEQEFYLIEELDFNLIIFHPYRSLVQICGRDGGPNAGGERGRERREKMLDMDETSLQMAWCVSFFAGLPPSDNADMHHVDPPSSSRLPDAITFLSSINVDHAIILEIVQEILALYELWNALEVTSAAGITGKGASTPGTPTGVMRNGVAVGAGGAGGGGKAVGVDERVIELLDRMRKDRQMDLAEMERERGRSQGSLGWKK
ncbi:hypothetical protein MNV49_002675 [Pseudohyphozyma bogoriensis]|nr:hypothetical protein MNV49_002675 [Pseudohyphozyma bogoriensis]